MKKLSTIILATSLALCGSATLAGTASAAETPAHSKELKHANIEAWTPSVRYKNCELQPDHNPTHQGIEWTLASSTSDSATYSIAAIPGYVLWSEGQEVAGPITVTVPVSNKLPASCTTPVQPIVINPTEPTVVYPTECATEGGQVVFPSALNATYAIIDNHMQHHTVRETAAKGYIFPNGSTTADFELASMRSLPEGCSIPVQPTPEPIPQPVPVVNVPVTVNNSNSNVNTITNNSYSTSSAVATSTSTSSSEATSSDTDSSASIEPTSTSASSVSSATELPKASAQASPLCLPALPYTRELDSAKDAGISVAQSAAVSPTSSIDWNLLSILSFIGLLVICATYLASVIIRKKA